LYLCKLQVAWFVSTHAELEAPLWIALAAARYFSLRWLCNTAVYIYQQAGKVCCDGCMPVRELFELARLVVSGYALLVDFALGLSLQLPAFIVALVPCISRLHVRLLFNTSTGKLDDALRKQAQGAKHLQKLIRQTSQQIRTSRAGSRAGSAANGPNNGAASAHHAVREAAHHASRRVSGHGREGLPSPGSEDEKKMVDEKARLVGSRDASSAERKQRHHRRGV